MQKGCRYFIVPIARHFIQKKSSMFAFYFHSLLIVYLAFALSLYHLNYFVDYATQFLINESAFSLVENILIVSIAQNVNN